MSVLITGSSGFIGSRLARMLVSHNIEVELFDVVDGKDICNIDTVRKSVAGKETVFHLAAVADVNEAKKHPLRTLATNVKGTWNMAMACMEYDVDMFFASTCAVYGNQKRHPVSELSTPNPAELYASSKLAGEDVVRGFHNTYGLPYNIMRFATVYGEGTKPSLGTHILMGQAIRGEPITVHGDGKQTRALTYILDIVDGITALYESGRINSTWNIATDEEVSALRMAQDIKKITGSKSEIIFVPQRTGQTFKESIATAKMEAEVGWSANTSWKDGLLRMYEWFRSTNQVSNKYDIV